MASSSQYNTRGGCDAKGTTTGTVECDARQNESRWRVGPGDRKPVKRWPNERASFLESATGRTNTDVGKTFGASANKWSANGGRGFCRIGSMGCRTSLGPGTPRRLSDVEIERVLTMTLQSTPQNATHWSTRSLAAACGLSRSSIHRVWRAFALAPHRSETFKLSRDPLFIAKVRDIVGLPWILPIKRWCCVWMRNLKSKPWIVRNLFCQCDRDRPSAGPMITNAMAPLLCSPPWTLRLAKSLANSIAVIVRLELRKFLDKI